jgi:hypothetical protein
VTFLGLAAGPAWCAESTARSLVAQSIANYENDWKAVLDYTYIERDVAKESSEKVELYQVTVVDGTPYNRLIARDGHPLDTEESRRQAEKYQKVLDARDKETPEQRARRIRKYDNERAFLKEIPDAFDMKMLGDETVDGRPNCVIQLTPKEGYVPDSKYARIFPSIEGKLWIDQHDMRWTKAVAQVIDTISFGWILARIGPGAHITMTQEKVGEHWFPKKIEVEGMARILLVKNRTIDDTIWYENYKRLNRSPAATDARNR